MGSYTGWRFPALLPLATLAVVSSFSAYAEQRDSASFAYLLHCAGCHLEDGASDPPAIPDLREDLDLFVGNAAGRSYMLRVPGVTDAAVAPQQMAELMNWMVARFYPQLSGFKPFTAEEVAAGRAKPLYDPVSHRRRLVSDLAAVLSAKPVE